MLCPACNIELSISDRAGVEIDFCPKCRGVWLDRGELDKIIERSANFTQTTQHSYNSTPHYNSTNNQQHYYKKKRESWLGELFDF